MNEDASHLLRVEQVSKSFPGVKALADVTLELNTGEILALVGENGAGKSTLIQILTGALEPDTGCLFLDGEEVHFKHPQEAESAGISAVYQELSLVNNLSVAENIFAGRQPLNGVKGSGWIVLKPLSRQQCVWVTFLLEISSWSRSPRRCPRMPDSLF